MWYDFIFTISNRQNIFTYLQCNLQHIYKNQDCVYFEGGENDWVVEWNELAFWDVGYETFVFKSKAGFRNVFTF